MDKMVGSRRVIFAICVLQWCSVLCVSADQQTENDILDSGGGADGILLEQPSDLQLPDSQLSESQELLLGDKSSNDIGSPGCDPDGHVLRYPRSANKKGNKSDNANDTEGGGEEEEEGLHLASWKFTYVAEPLIFSIFIIVAGLLKIGFHYAEFLSRILPESCLIIIFGIVSGVVLHYTGTGDYFEMTPRLFLLFLLPPIVLDSAYGLHNRVFAENLGTILLYAVVGTIINFVLIGPALYGLAISGAMGTIKITMVQCLLFSSFIVAVDPVAVLAIFQEVGVNDVLYVLVFGESLLNDGVTVVISNVMKAFSEMDEIPPYQIGIGVGAFFTVSLGGVTVGFIFGLLTALMTRLTGKVRVVEPLAVLVLAYMSYIGAELFHFSGIISCIVCGLTQAQYSFHNISTKSHTTVIYFIKMLASTMDSIIFMFLGLELVRTPHKWHTGFVLWSMALCLIVRLISVYGQTFFVNMSRKRVHYISMSEQFIMWYGGLRGAVCFALCETINDKFEHKHMFLTTTLFVIMFTVFIQGITVKPLVTLCKIQTRSDEEECVLLFEEVHKRLTDHIMAGVEVITKMYGENRLRAMIFELNDRYMRKIFQNDPRTTGERIIDVYKMVAIRDYESTVGKKGALMRRSSDDSSSIDTVGGMEVSTQTTGLRQRTGLAQSAAGAQTKRKTYGSFIGRIFGRSEEEEEVSTNTLHKLFDESRTSALHYDPDLTRDTTDNDLLHQLNERHKRVQRLQSYKRKSVMAPPETRGAEGGLFSMAEAIIQGVTLPMVGQRPRPSPPPPEKPKEATQTLQFGGESVAVPIPEQVEGKDDDESSVTESVLL